MGEILYTSRFECSFKALERLTGSTVRDCFQSVTFKWALSECCEDKKDYQTNIMAFSHRTMLIRYNRIRGQFALDAVVEKRVGNAQACSSKAYMCSHVFLQAWWSCESDRLRWRWQQDEVQRKSWQTIQEDLVRPWAWARSGHGTRLQRAGRLRGFGPDQRALEGVSEGQGGQASRSRRRQTASAARLEQQGKKHSEAGEQWAGTPAHA